MFDVSGTNVALRKPATASSRYAGAFVLQRLLPRRFCDIGSRTHFPRFCSVTRCAGTSDPQTAVDGDANPRSYPSIFHSNEGAGGWWMVDLGANFNVRRVVYYNRRDCCSNRMNGGLLQVRCRRERWRVTSFVCGM